MSEPLRIAIVGVCLRNCPGPRRSMRSGPVSWPDAIVGATFPPGVGPSIPPTCSRVAVRCRTVLFAARLLPRSSSERSGRRSATRSAFHLAVAICRSAWNDAVHDTIDRRRVGLVLGSIALPTERISALSRDVLSSIVRGEPCDRWRLRHLDVVGRPASLVAEILGFGGLQLTLDAACASSLYACKIACD